MSALRPAQTVARSWGRRPATLGQAAIELLPGTERCQPKLQTAAESCAWRAIRGHGASWTPRLPRASDASLSGWWSALRAGATGDRPALRRTGRPPQAATQLEGSRSFLEPRKREEASGGSPGRALAGTAWATSVTADRLSAASRRRVRAPPHTRVLRRIIVAPFVLKLSRPPCSPAGPATATPCGPATRATSRTLPLPSPRWPAQVSSLVSRPPPRQASPMLAACACSRARVCVCFAGGCQRASRSAAAASVRAAAQVMIPARTLAAAPKLTHHWGAWRQRRLSALGRAPLPAPRSPKAPSQALAETVLCRPLVT